MKTKILFMGSTSFAAHLMNELIKNEYDVVGLVTQPDRKVGRKQVITFPVTKTLALENNIEVYQFENINDHYNDLSNIDCDLIITCAYGQKISQEILDLPRLKCINVHASILPKYRGGAPIHHAIMAGDEKTGNTIMYMEESLDSGDIISQSNVVIDIDDTLDCVYDKLMIDAGHLLLDTLPDFINGNIKAFKQDESKVIYSPTIPRELEFIDFNRDVLKVYNHMRGLISWPGCYAYFNKKKIKFYNVKYQANDSSLKVGEVKILDDCFSIGCLNGYIKVYEFQLEGKKKISYLEYKNGNKKDIIDNTFFNEEIDNENKSK